MELVRNGLVRFESALCCDVRWFNCSNNNRVSFPKSPIREHSLSETIGGEENIRFLFLCLQTV